MSRLTPPCLYLKRAACLGLAGSALLGCDVHVENKPAARSDAGVHSDAPSDTGYATEPIPVGSNEPTETNASESTTEPLPNLADGAVADGSALDAPDTSPNTYLPDAGSLPDAGAAPQGDTASSYFDASYVTDRDPTPPNGDGTVAPEPPVSAYVLSRPSRCTSIDITEDDALVAAVNTERDSLSIFDAKTGELRSSISVGDEPSAVVLHPSGQSAFVVNRAARSVYRIDGIKTAAPYVGAQLALGSEPVCAALSPDGATLFVSEWAEGSLAVIETAGMTLSQVLEGPNNPHGLAVTSDLVITTEFYGDVSNDKVDLGKDQMFTSGRVRIFEPSGGDTSDSVDAYEETAPIVFAARDSTFADPRNAEGTTTVGPNQLHSVTVNGGKIYVTATGTAPLGVPRFNANVFPMIYVGDLAERKEDTGAQGTQNLAALVRDNLAETERNFAADLLAIDFAPGTEIAYAVSRAGDVVQRLNFASEPVEFGSNATGVKQIAVGGSLERCLAPNGIVTLHAGGVAWVNCFASFRLAQIAFDTQSVQQLVATASFDTEDPVNLGRRFFHTGNARWSSQAWSSCASCHPNGLSDNVTYQFPAGPRQSTELGGSYLEEDGKLVQRIFNWTGIFDEVHDFMANTTLVQGGARPLFPAEGQDCSGETIGFSAAAQFNAGLAAPMRDVEDTSCNPTDFDDMEAYLKTIRSARGLVRLQPDAVERGREVFVAGGCNDCHGGERTTLSRLFFEPSAELNALLATQEFAPPAAFLPSWSLNRTLQIQIQDPGGATEQAPPQVSCVIRRVGTFGFGTDEEVTSAIEQRGNDAASRAQGEGGYNIPALYGLALGAPFLHHGAARSLDELFRDPAFANHWQAANANFLTGPYADDDRANLIQYLLALDEATPNTHPPAADAGKDACPSVVKL